MENLTLADLNGLNKYRTRGINQSYVKYERAKDRPTEIESNNSRWNSKQK